MQFYIWDFFLRRCSWSCLTIVQVCLKWFPAVRILFSSVAHCIVGKSSLSAPSKNKHIHCVCWHPSGYVLCWLCSLGPFFIKLSHQLRRNRGGLLTDFCWMFSAWLSDISMCFHIKRLQSAHWNAVKSALLCSLSRNVQSKPPLLQLICFL